MPEDKSEDLIERIDESIGLSDRPNVPMPGPMPPRPDDDPQQYFDPEQLTNAEKIKVLESMFKYHPGQHVRNLLNENGYVHTIGLTIDGRRIYGVIHTNQNFQYYTAAEIKSYGFQEKKDAKASKRTDIDESTIKQSFLKQQQDILKDELNNMRNTKRL